MEDIRIIELYWQRDETAIEESETKYGSYCGTIAGNILHSKEDTMECVNDTWFRAWNSMPPEKPGRLAVFFGRITRNLAIDRYRKNKAQKYGGGQTAICLDELSECIGEERPVEDKIALRDSLNTFLSSLSEKNRNIFLLRYWYMFPVNKISEQYSMSEGAVKMTLQRIRKKLREFLEREGVGI